MYIAYGCIFVAWFLILDKNLCHTVIHVYVYMYMLIVKANNMICTNLPPSSLRRIIFCFIAGYIVNFKHSTFQMFNYDSVTDILFFLFSHDIHNQYKKCKIQINRRMCNCTHVHVHMAWSAYFKEGYVFSIGSSNRLFSNNVIAFHTSLSSTSLFDVVVIIFSVPFQYQKNYLSGT